MEPKLEESIVKDFIISSTTGAATDADSLPTCGVYEDATDASIPAATVAKRTGLTGHYRATIDCTAANGFEVNKSYNVIVSAVVGGIAAKSCILTFQVRANNVADVMTVVNTNANAVARLLALAGENSGARNEQYDSSGNLISVDLCAYDTPTHTVTNDGVTGLVYKWVLAFTYASGRQTAQSLERVL